VRPSGIEFPDKIIEASLLFSCCAWRPDRLSFEDAVLAIMASVLLLPARFDAL
jgi:hypothetical protein